MSNIFDIPSVSRESSKAFLDYFTVVSAVEGDEESLRAVMRFFSSTIRRKATRPCIDNNGNRSFYIDPFVKGHIESSLMEAILKFPMDE